MAATNKILAILDNYLHSLKNLIVIAMALEYTSEIRHLFSEQKYDTTEELQQVKRNINRKKAYGK